MEWLAAAKQRLVSAFVEHREPLHERERQQDLTGEPEPPYRTPATRAERLDGDRKLAAKESTLQPRLDERRCVRSAGVGGDGRTVACIGNRRLGATTARRVTGNIDGG